MKTYRVTLPICVIANQVGADPQGKGGEFYPAGSQIELDDATALEYKHALAAIAPAQAEEK